jgi:hypothetical protein
MSDSSFREMGLSLLVGNMIGAFCGFLLGSAHGMQVERERHECFYTQQRACVFGPAIVGVQECGTDARWQGCKPDPKHCPEETKR